MTSAICDVPVVSEDVTPSGTRVHAPQETLFVSTALARWVTHEPERIARDFQINDTVYRRLDPEYYAWLRSRMNLAQLAPRPASWTQPRSMNCRGSSTRSTTGRWSDSGSSSCWPPCGRWMRVTTHRRSLNFSLDFD